MHKKGKDDAVGSRDMDSGAAVLRGVLGKFVFPPLSRGSFFWPRRIVIDRGAQSIGPRGSWRFPVGKLNGLVFFFFFFLTPKAGLKLWPVWMAAQGSVGMFERGFG